MLRPNSFLDVYNKLMSVPDLIIADMLGKQMVLAMADDDTAIPIYSNINARVTQPYVHTNYLNIHHRVWDVNLDWMEKH